MRKRNAAIAPGCVRIPITRCKDLATVVWWDGKLYGMEHRTGGVVVVEAKPWLDTSDLSDTKGGTGPALEMCELLSASGAKAAEIAIFARRLRKDIEGQVRGFLKEQGATVSEDT